MQLQGKTVVVTGGGRGIGREIAKGFAARGAHVALFDLRQEDLDESMRQCVAAGAALGTRAAGYLVNVTREAEVIAALDAVVATSGDSTYSSTTPAS